MIGFDADDTLWHSEDGFRANEHRFVELIAPFAPDGVDVKAALTATERKNLSTFGYGVKSFGAVDGRGGDHDQRRAPSPPTVIAELVEMVRAQLEEPVRLLPHVPEVLAKVGARVQAGADHQGRPRPPDPQGRRPAVWRITSSTSRSCWRRTSRPTPGVLPKFGVDPTRFCMVGNSVRSDILPVMALGGHAVHVPYPICCGSSSTSTTTSTSPSSSRWPTSPPGSPTADFSCDARINVTVVGALCER